MKGLIYSYIQCIVDDDVTDSIKFIVSSSNDSSVAPTDLSLVTNNNNNSYCDCSDL